YGYSMPIAVRYTQDAFSRSGWLWPVDAKGEPLKATSYMAVGFYVAKYVNKKSDMDLAAKGLLKCNWTIRKRLPRCKMRLKKRLLAFSRRLHARIRKTRYMHKMRCLLINRRSLLLALRLLWKTPIFPS